MREVETSDPASDPKRVATGIAGLDALIEGGVPPRSLVLLGGRPGTGKTLLSAQFLLEGANHGEPTIFVSFAESQNQFLANMQRFGLDFRSAIGKELFEYIDLTTVTGEAASDALDLIVTRVASMKAKRLVIDSFTAIAQGFEKAIDARIALHVIVGKLVKEEDCTTMLLVEMPYGTDTIGMGMEEFVADGIIVLDVIKHKGGVLRTITLRKMRGTSIDLNPSTYEISSSGLDVFPSMNLARPLGIGSERLATHIPGFDELAEGGFLTRSLSALVGAAGTGKTTFGLQFIFNGATQDKERGLFISFGESRDQLKVLASKLGLGDVTKLTGDGSVTLEGILPEGRSIDAHVHHIERLLSDSDAKRVVFDDVTALQSICTDEEFYLLVKRLSLLVKSKGATAVLTVTTPDLSGNLVTGVRLSTIVDSIVLFRYVEIEGRMDRSLVLLKMRGTKLDSSIKRFLIDSKGITVDGTFEGYTGILTGTAQRMLQHFVRSEARIAEAEGKARARRRKDFGKKIKKKTH